MQIGADEASHVATLTATIQKLGGTPAGAPAVDFGGAFERRKSYLTTAHIFENKGVGAYLGAAGFVKDKMILQAAAGIFGVEARHAAVVGNLLGLKAEGGVYMGAVREGHLQEQHPRRGGPVPGRPQQGSCRNHLLTQAPAKPTPPAGPTAGGVEHLRGYWGWWESGGRYWVTRREQW